MNLAKRLPAIYLVLTAFTIFFMLVSCGDGNGNSDDTDNCGFWVEIAEITNPSIYIQDVFFIDNDTGWVVGAKQEPHVFSFDNDTGWVVGAKLEPLFTGYPEQRILKTTDGGYTWIDQLPSGQIGYLYSVYFIDQNKGWVGGGSWTSGQIYSTSNEGDIWDFSNIGDSGFIMDIHAIDSNNVWAVGSGLVGVEYYVGGAGYTGADIGSVNTNLTGADVGIRTVAFYNPENGRGIYSTDQKIEVYPDWVDTGLNDMQLYYFPDGVPTAREEMSPTITGDDPVVVDSAIAFSGFPDDAKVKIDGDEFQLTDGAINFTPTTPGNYLVWATHPAFINWRRSFDAN